MAPAACGGRAGLRAALGLLLLATAAAQERHLLYAGGCTDVDDTVAAINDIRARHGAAPLAWDDNLAQSAANHASDCWFHHSMGPYGENLMASWGFDQSKICSTAVNGWYQEAQNYDYSNPGNSLNGQMFLHFTALTWASTTAFGCAFKLCPNTPPGWVGADYTGSRDMQYVVCQFNPSGNWQGQFAANVFPPGTPAPQPTPSPPPPQQPTLSPPPPQQPTPSPPQQQQLTPSPPPVPVPEPPPPPVPVPEPSPPPVPQPSPVPQPDSKGPQTSGTVKVRLRIAGSDCGRFAATAHPLYQSQLASRVATPTSDWTFKCSDKQHPTAGPWLLVYYTFATEQPAAAAEVLRSALFDGELSGQVSGQLGGDYPITLSVQNYACVVGDYACPA